MPELPEVETVVRDLRPLILDRSIRRLRVSRRKLRNPWQAAWTTPILGQRFKALDRRGKWIIARLDVGALLLHLGMTGQLTVQPASSHSGNHTHLRFLLDNDCELRFRDVRRFGSATYFAATADLDVHLNVRLGPEPFGVDADYFRACLRSTQRPLKAVLLDQTVLAGVGNIYADEACHRAGLHPARVGATLSVPEVDRLRLAVESVLRAAIESRGSTIRDYIGGSGLRGRFQDDFAVYGRTGRPCVRCESLILCLRIAGRSSHFCPRCQPLRPGRR